MKKIIIALILIMNFNALALNFDSLNIGHHGKYVWRGLVFNQKPVNQGDINFSYNNFEASMWWNFDVSTEDKGDGTNDDRDNFSELDYTISYAIEINEISLKGGFIYYYFPRAVGDFNETREFFISITSASLFNLNLTIYRDINETRGTYFNLNFSENIEIKYKDYKVPVSIKLDLGFNTNKNWIGYYNESLQSNSSGLSNIALTISSFYDLSDQITLEPYVSYSALLNGAHNNEKNRNGSQSAKPRNIWVGVNLNMVF